MPSTATVTLNAEHSEFKWLTFEDATRMVPFAGQRKVLKHIREEFVDRAPSAWLLIRETAAAEG